MPALYEYDLYSIVMAYVVDPYIGVEHIVTAFTGIACVFVACIVATHCNCRDRRQHSVCTSVSSQHFDFVVLVISLKVGGSSLIVC